MSKSIIYVDGLTTFVMCKCGHLMEPRKILKSNPKSQGTYFWSCGTCRCYYDEAKLAIVRRLTGSIKANDDGGVFGEDDMAEPDPYSSKTQESTNNKSGYCPGVTQKKRKMGATNYSDNIQVDNEEK